MVTETPNIKRVKQRAEDNDLVLWAIVLPENWTGGLDGESEETIIPS